MTLTDSEFLDDRPIPRDCEHGTLARQCELCDCKTELAAARAELERAMKVIEAVQRYYGNKWPFGKSVFDALKEWEAGR